MNNDAIDDAACRLLDAIGYIHLEERKAEKSRLRIKYRLLVRMFPHESVKRPDLLALTEPEQWKKLLDTHRRG